MTLEELKKQFYKQMIKNGFRPWQVNTIKGEYTNKSIKVFWIIWEQCARVNGLLKEGE